MKVFFRLLAGIALLVVVVITVIKLVQRCSWKDALGIAEQLCKEVSEPFRSCCRARGEKTEEV